MVQFVHGPGILRLVPSPEDPPPRPPFLLRVTVGYHLLSTFSNQNNKTLGWACDEDVDRKRACLRAHPASPPSPVKNNRFKPWYCVAPGLDAL